jgi:hypothetical protein
MTEKTEKNPKGAGRQKTLSREEYLFNIWEMVQREIHIYGAKNVAQACEVLVHRKTVRNPVAKKISFKDETGKQVGEKLEDASTLRRWFSEAKKKETELIKAGVAADSYLCQRMAIVRAHLAKTTDETRDLLRQARKNKLKNTGQG